MNLIQSSFESEKIRQINECQKIQLLRTNHTEATVNPVLETLTLHVIQTFSNPV